MTAVAAVSSDMNIGTVGRTPTVSAVSFAPAVRAAAAVSPEKNQPDAQSPAKSAGSPAAMEAAGPAPLQTRTVTFSDAATGILIQADQNAMTGEKISQFPDRALIESYAQQIRIQTGQQVRATGP